MLIPPLFAHHTQISDASSDVIQVDGLLRFFQEIHLDVYSIYALVFNWRLGAVEQGQWTRDEFCNGLVALGFVRNAVKEVKI